MMLITETNCTKKAVQLVDDNIYATNIALADLSTVIVVGHKKKY